MFMRWMAVAAALFLSQSAAAMDKSEFTAEVNKLWKINDQYGEAAYQKMLARDDLTEGQRRLIESSLINYRHNKGDDMTGAMLAMEDYINKYPDNLDRRFLDDMDFMLTQYIAVSGRVADATEYSEQIVLDTWNLGYWVDALVAYMNSMVPMSRDLKDDMVRAGYLCFHDGNKDNVIIPYSINDVPKNLTFCPQGTVVKINTPQPYQENNWQTKIGQDRDHARELKANISMMIANLP